MIAGIAFDPFQRQLAYTAAAAVVAVIAAVIDVRSRRVPNWLTGPAMLLALVAHLVFDGWHGLLSSIAAAAICFAIFAVFYVAGGMGAGDVKLIAAAGGLAGLNSVAFLLIFTALVGGVMAVGLAVARGRLRETLGNVSSIATHHLREGLSPHPELHVRNSTQLRLPYAVAIAAGCLITLWLQGQG